MLLSGGPRCKGLLKGFGKWEALGNGFGKIPVLSSQQGLSNGLILRRALNSIRLAGNQAAANLAEPRVALGDDVASLNQEMRIGSYESSLVQKQMRKQDDGQPSIASSLPPADPTKQYDVAVVGAGPAGMFLAAEVAKQGLSVVIVGLDLAIVNNYGVWVDEFKELGMEHTLECSWPDAVCYFGEGHEQEVRVGRAYGRVSRRKLREHLVKECAALGVAFMDAEVSDMSVQEDLMGTRLATNRGVELRARLVSVAAGAAGGKFLEFEDTGPSVAAQTAYGIEAEVEGFEGAFDPSLMTFMDFRRHHTGLWDQTGLKLKPGKHPANGEGIWGTNGEAPSFIYAMPLGGNRVFLEETCLVAKPALPFAVLKRRLERRLKALGITITEVHEEEWSYIPVGGPLPLANQNFTAFGAAASLVHPATGFSVSRSFREAPGVAAELASVLKERLTVPQASQRVWEKLWPQEKRAQASFHVFGMELLAGLDLASTNSFFFTFFRLPLFFWRGFLASTLTSTQLVAFALMTFLVASLDIKIRLVQHLLTDPAGAYLIAAYKGLINPASGPPPPAIDPPMPTAS